MRLGGLGERFSSPSGSGRSPAAKRYLVNFRLKNLAAAFKVMQRVILLTPIIENGPEARTVSEINSTDDAVRQHLHHLVLTTSACHARPVLQPSVMGYLRRASVVSA